MKVFFGLISLCLISLSISCTREPQREEDMQREHPLRQDDIRENDSFTKEDRVPDSL